MPISKKSLIDGNNILYHFLQKELFTNDIWLFQMLAAKLVASLGIWFHPETYKKIPIILPFVIRDPSCRKRKENEIENWGSPNELGYLRDDNSLIKGLPKSLMVISSKQEKYNNKKIGKGFVGSHVWREIDSSPVNAKLSTRDPLLNSFIPNLVWLPSQVSKLTDREGMFTQLYLQALSAKIYRNVKVFHKHSQIVEKAWNMLVIPEGIPEQGLPDLNELSFFEDTDKFYEKRKMKIEAVVNAFKLLLEGKPLTTKVITTRYGEGLKNIPLEKLNKLYNFIKNYLESMPISD